eukprot:Nitzschia sp. Nitz4//scaffold126_size65214//26625//27965//NITZ4_006153-RA/size65214-processed-gene-0.24-mRNA-1//1//CDS//3329534680//8554//frame0
MVGMAQNRKQKPRFQLSAYKRILVLISISFLFSLFYLLQEDAPNVYIETDATLFSNHNIDPPPQLSGKNNSSPSTVGSFDPSIAWSNETTLAFYEGKFFSGFRNQMMAFTMIVFQAIAEGDGQILLQSVRMKDTYGTNRHLAFDKLWDAVHWNAYYPQLPRLVNYNETIHIQYNPKAHPPWNRNSKSQFCSGDGNYCTDSPEKPRTTAKQSKLMGAYTRYAIGKGPHAEGGHRHPAEKLMLQHAMRPHPDLQTIIQTNIESSPLQQGHSYMTIHARIEPDMQMHIMCPKKKVLNLTDIFNMVYDQWPEPPVPAVFLPVNRETLEEGAKISPKKPSKTNWIAVENLRVLNEARDKGMWNGRVPVVEFGSKALDGTVYAAKPSTAGAMLNFFVAMNASIFVGSEVSSYAHDLLATRFFRGMGNNYKYLPDGLQDWTPPGTVDPPGFQC